MKILLTPDQESTLWHFTEKVLTPKGDAYYCFPFALRIEPDGMFERVPLNSLPDEVKKHLAIGQGLKLEPTEEETIHDWIMRQENAIMATEYLYHFDYNGIDCAGLVTRYPFGNTLQIRPKTSTGDIGFGAGMAETKYFKR